MRYQTHLEQSHLLQRDLLTLTVAVHKFGGEPTKERADTMKQLISRFYDRSLRFLMYRDWSSFESFASELLKCDSIPGLIQIAHRFETYLKTLLREVGKRGVLQPIDAAESEETPDAEPRLGLS